jgi:hypothetical protein
MVSSEPLSNGQYIAAIVATIGCPANLQTVIHELRLARLKIGSILEELENLAPDRDAIAKVREASESVVDETNRLGAIVRRLAER